MVSEDILKPTSKSCPSCVTFVLLFVHTSLPPPLPFTLSLPSLSIFVCVCVLPHISNALNVCYLYICLSTQIFIN